MNQKHLLIFRSKSIHGRHGYKYREMVVLRILIGVCRIMRAEVIRKAISWHKEGLY